MITQADRTEDAAVRGAGGIGGFGNVGLLLAAVAAVCGLLGGRLVDMALVDGYGLLRALPPLYWVGVAAGVPATFVLLWTAAVNGRGRYAAAAPLLWLLLLHTAPQLANDHPRFPAVWSHLGFLRYIDETRTGDVVVDARFAWPGFHGTFMVPLAGLDGWVLDLLLRTWPTWITGGTAILVAALARRSYPTVPLIGSLSALLYVLLAWTGHDHFSPQSVGLVWFMAILVILESGPLQTGSAWSASVPILPRFSASGGDRPASRSTPAFVALVILSFGAVVSDPLAPLFIAVALVLLGLYGRALAWRLLLIFGVAFVLWFLIAAGPWWSSRLGDMVEPARTVVGDSAAESAEYRLVTTVRTYLGAATFLAALATGVAMAGERLRHLRPAVPLVPLVAVPLVAVVLRGGDGDTMTRVLLFTLPPASILIGRVLATFRVRTVPVVATAAAVVLTPLLLIARFGGERFEFTSEPDRAAIEAAYARADDDTLFVADNRFVPWRDRAVGRNDFTEHTTETSEAWIEAIEAEAAEAGRERIIVVLTDGQLGWKIHGEGRPPEVLDEFAEWLLDRPGSELLFHEESSWAIEL